MAQASGCATLKPPAKVTPSKARPIGDEPRLDWILTQLSHELTGADFVVIEGLAYGSKTGKVTERAGLSWLVRMQLWWTDTPYVMVPPTTRAMYGTGKGNADKETVFVETLKRFGHLFDINNNNEADAVLLYAMGMERLGAPLVDLPATHTRAMGSVVWPDLQK